MVLRPDLAESAIGRWQSSVNFPGERHEVVARPPRREAEEPAGEAGHRVERGALGRGLVGDPGRVLRLVREDTEGVGEGIVPCGGAQFVADRGVKIDVARAYIGDV